MRAFLMAVEVVKEGNRGAAVSVVSLLLEAAH
jgi:hypothetical protein